jgi:hypothetical protein
MVRQYYVDEITNLSEQELHPVCETVEPPACLLGGWAVHLHVDQGFQDAYGRGYIGSRDIDIGFRVDPAWSEDDLPDTPVGRSLRNLEEQGYVPLSFRLVRYFDRETGDIITEEESKQLPPHQVFQMFLDVIPDTEDLDTFHDVFGFHPPAEPMLRPAFEEDAAEPITQYRAWDLPDTMLIADPDLLAAMKIRSIPLRDKDQKRVKDIADLHALLWYVTEYRDMKRSVVRRVTRDDLERMGTHLAKQGYEDAADLIGVDPELIQDSIEQLIADGTR